MSQKKKQRDEKWLIAVIEREGRYLLFLNEKPGLLSGLWQFPTKMLEIREGPIRKERTDRKERGALKKRIQEEFAMEIQVQAPLPEQKYLFTHISATLKPYLCSLIRMGNDFPRLPKVRWVKPANFSRYPISTAMRKIIALIPKSREKRLK